MCPDSVNGGGHVAVVILTPGWKPHRQPYGGSHIINYHVIHVWGNKNPGESLAAAYGTCVRHVVSSQVFPLHSMASPIPIVD
jgi:hypothetical protein